MNSMPRALTVALFVGVAFGAGLAWGTRSAVTTTTTMEHSTDTIAAAIVDANERTAAYEALVKAQTKTWHRELSSNDVVEPPTLPKNGKAKAEKVVAMPAVSAPAAEVVAAVRETLQEPAAPAPAPVVDDAKAADDDEGDVAQPQAPDPARLQQALTKVLGDVSKPEASTSGRTYAVQLASTGTEDGARAIADGFSQRGFAAVVVAAEVAGRGQVFRVRLTGQPTRAAAEALKARVGQGLVVAE